MMALARVLIRVLTLPILLLGKLLQYVGWFIQQLSSPTKQELLSALRYQYQKAEISSDRMALWELIREVQSSEAPLTTELLRWEEAARQISRRRLH